MVLCLCRLEASLTARSGRPLVSFSGQAPLKRNNAEVGAPSGGSRRAVGLAALSGTHIQEHPGGVQRRLPQ